MFLDHTQQRTSRWDSSGRVISSASGRSPAEIVGSNPTEGMDICLL